MNNDTIFRSQIITLGSTNNYVLHVSFLHHCDKQCYLIRNTLLGTKGTGEIKSLFYDSKLRETF